MAPKKKPEEVIPLTTEQKCERARKLLYDAEVIRDYTWKEEFLTRAVNICKEVKESGEAGEELTAAAEEITAEAGRLSKELLYMECKNRRKKADKRKESASTEADYKDAVAAYQDLIQFQEDHSEAIEQLSPKQKSALAALSDPRKEIDDCRSHMTRAVKKVFSPGKLIFAAVIIIIIALAGFSQTALSRRLAGNAAEAIGQQKLAAKAYHSAYWRGHDEADRDSYERCLYACGINLYTKKKDDSGLSCFKELAEENYRDSADYAAELEIAAIKEANPGDLVDYGNTQWIVLAKENGEAVLHIKGALDPVSLNGTQDTTWEDSCFRKWLNETYIQNFTDAEISYMEKTDVHTADNPDYNTSGGNDTTDYLYLLSIDELETYNQFLSETTQNCWWLRTPGANKGTFAFSNVNKTPMSYGYLSGSEEIRIKPTFRIRLQ